jgi:hypothetical protein
MVLWDWETENSAFHTENGIDYKNFRLPYWLDYAKELGENSPILVVRTKYNDNEDEDLIDKKTLKEKYNLSFAVC